MKVRASLPEAAESNPRAITRLDAGRGYARWAASYDHTPNPLLACEERHVLPLLPVVNGKRVLDLACGTGRWMELLAARGAHVLGIDISAAMLGTAAGKAALQGRLLQADGRRLPFSGGCFDFAICSFASGHIAELGDVIAELRAVLKPGSELVLTEMHPDAHARGWRTRFRGDEGVVEIETVPRTADEWIRGFAGGGFECVRQSSFYFGAPEERFFAAGGKSDAFLDACQVPSILVCQFRRPQHPAARLT